VRDTDGSVNVGKCNSSDLTSTGILTLTVGTALTTTATVAGAGTVYAVDATGGNFTVTLPPAATVAGRVYVFKKTTAANTVTIDGDGSDAIDGGTTTTLSSQWSKVTLISNGVQWFIIA
jgi:hypothetical protein